MAKDHFWQAQSSKAFVKAKSDWLSAGKVHLSFVQHSNGKQEAFIDAALDYTKSDGVIYLMRALGNGTISKLKKKSEEAAKAKGDKYPAAFFSVQGGSRAKENRPCLFREVSISPATANGYDVMLAVRQCEGKENKNGGYVPVEGATFTSIRVPMTMADLLVFTELAYAEYIAFRSASLTTGKEIDMRWKPEGSEENNEHQQPAQSAPPAQAQPGPALKKVFIMYDTRGLLFKNVPVAVDPSKIDKHLQEAIIALQKTKGRFCIVDKKEYSKALEQLQSGTGTTVGLAFKAKDKEAFEGRPEEEMSDYLIITMSEILC